jgi:hypothetical protein
MTNEELYSENVENGMLDQCPRCGETWSPSACHLVEGDALEIDCTCSSCNFVAKQFALVRNVTWWGVREHEKEKNNENIQS